MKSLLEKVEGLDESLKEKNGFYFPDMINHFDTNIDNSINQIN